MKKSSISKLLLLTALFLSISLSNCGGVDLEVPSESPAGVGNDENTGGGNDSGNNNGGTGNDSGSGGDSTGGGGDGAGSDDGNVGGGNDSGNNNGGTGNDSGSGGDSTGGNQATKTYLPYSGSLVLVDPDDLNNSIIVSNATHIDWSIMKAVNSWDPQTRTYSDFHMHEIFFIENSKSPVYAVSLVKGSQFPQKRQVSNINNACILISAYYDLLNKKAFLKVKTAGTDNTCDTADDRIVLINNTMSNSTAPIDITGKEILTSISGGFQNPAITGFIAIDNQNNIQSCDINMQCANIGQYSNNINYVGDNPTNGHIYLCIDGTLNLFNGQSLNPLGIPCGSYPIWDFYFDENSLYAKDPNGNIMKLNHGENSWTTIYSGGDIDSILSSTNNYLLAQTSGGGLKAIRKDDGFTVTLSDSKTSWPIPSGDTVFFNKYATTQSCKWTEGSSQPTCTNNAYIAGFTISTHGTWSMFIHKILEVRNVDTLGPIPVGGVLYSVDPVTGNSIPLGQVPQNMTMSAIGIGNYTLSRGYDPNNDQGDIFFADVTQQNSLQRLTNTPNVDESIVF